MWLHFLLSYNTHQFLRYCKSRKFNIKTNLTNQLLSLFYDSLSTYPTAHVHCVARVILRHISLPLAKASNPDEVAVKSAEKYVMTVVDEEIVLARQGRKRKSTESHCYTDDVCTAIGKHVLRYGNKSAVEAFTKTLDFSNSS